jgi:hypothetical protein
VHDNYIVNSIPWGAIDVALADVRFRTLRRFAFNRFASSDFTRTVGSKITPEARLMMPLANARGIIV